MSTRRYIHRHDTPLGSVTMASDGISLTGLWFDGQKYFPDDLKDACEEGMLAIFTDTSRWLDIYFGESIPDFTPPLCFEATPFRRKVWEILQTIPYGQTMTYGEIANLLAQSESLSQMSSRAIGNAVGHNPISLVIPCHRVIGANGSLTGYAGGLDRKRRLIELERRRI